MGTLSDTKTTAAFLWGDPDPDHPKGTQPTFLTKGTTEEQIGFHLFGIISKRNLIRATSNSIEIPKAWPL